AAAPGFLAVQRLVVMTFGPTEFAIRLFPFLCGIFALLFFTRLSRAILPPSGALIAISLFALSDHLIYYSSEGKQYSVDVFGTILCYTLYSWAPKGEVSA